jgi:hypothetical protein
MIICTGCGHSNGTSDAFCGSCGGFLEWDGEQVAAPVAAPAVPRLAHVPAPREEPVAAPAPVVSAPVVSAPVVSAPVVSAPVVSAPVSARPPGAEYERPAPLRPDPVDLGPADLYCGSCGGGNASGRAFCRRCGSSLADAEHAGRLSWWRRLLARLRRTRRSLSAGERPAGWAVPEREAELGHKRKKSRRRRLRMPTRLSLGKAALPIALLSLAGFGLAPVRAHVTQFVFGAWKDGRKAVAPRYVPVSASGATASSALAHHDASAAIDQNTLTWWAEGASGRGRGQKLVVRFDRSVDLDRVAFYDGAAAADYPLQPRVRGVRITLRGPHGLVAERRTVLADKRSQQLVEVSGHDVTQVVISVLSTYAGQKGSAASLAEVGFLSKQ